MFLLSSGLSHFIKKDSFKCKLNLLFSFKRITKSLQNWLHDPSAECGQSIADFLGFLIRFPVKGVVRRCSEALTKKCLSQSP